MKQPAGYLNSTLPHVVCKLKRALYGLKQAVRAWFEKLKTTLITLGFQNSKSNIFLFIFKKDKVVIYLIVYVDNILVIGNDESQIKHIIAVLSKEFALKSLRSMNYFQGFKATRNSVGIHLT